LIAPRSGNWPRKIPDFSAGYTYQKTGPGFRDYYMLSLGAKIPLYFWRKQKPAVEQAVLERESAKERLRASKLDAASEIDRDWISVKTQERVMNLYRDGLLPQARATFESAMASYRTGRVDFQTLLSAAIEQLNMKEEYYRAMTDREIAIARIEQMIGENL
jgi:outer membrane protein TolC